MRRKLFITILFLSMAANIGFALSLFPMYSGGGIDLTDATDSYVASVWILEEKNFLRDDVGEEKLRIEVKSVADSQSAVFEIKTKPNNFENLHEIRDNADAAKWEDGRLIITPNNHLTIRIDPQEL